MALSDAQFVACYRVSIERQGESGLGLAASGRRSLGFLGPGGAPPPCWPSPPRLNPASATPTAPELLRAIELSRRQKATLVIAKLDRLARNVHFISGLTETGVEFVAADMPEANRLTIHILAAFAEHEREAISQRTEEALQAARKRGTRLGNPRWAESIAQARQIRDPIPPAPQLVEMMRRHRAEGMTLRAIAAQLNGLGTAHTQRIAVVCGDRSEGNDISCLTERVFTSPRNSEGHRSSASFRPNWQLT